MALRVLASRFGAGTELDVYYSAFRIPDLVFNLLVLGALSAAFIPVFIEYRQRDHEEGWDVARHFISAAVVVTFVACVIMAIFAPLVGWARIRLKHHTPVQILIGWMVSMICVFVVFQLML